MFEEVKELTMEEIKLLDDMKREYLKEDRKKFNLLCRLEDFVVQYQELWDEAYIYTSENGFRRVNNNE